jgi:hypothetical protein
VVSFLLAFPPDPICIRATCPVHLFLIDFIILIIIGGDYYKLWSSPLCGFLQPPITSSLFGLIILLRASISNTLSLYYSSNIRYQIPHPYKTTPKNSFLYIYIYIYIYVLRF